MNYTEEEIIYRLFKKGPENLTDFDKLLIKSNPRIKEGFEKLSSGDSKEYEAILKLAEEKAAVKKKAALKQRRILLYVPFPAAALFLLIFTFIFKFSKPPESLGGKVYLFVSPEDDRDTFYSQGGFFDGGEQITLAFQPDADLKEIQQGFVFSVDSNLDSEVYYRYNSLSGSLDRSRSTGTGQTVRLKKDIDYIYFFVILSEEPFNEEEQIARVKTILEKKQPASGTRINKELKNKAFSYLYLRKRP